MTEKTATKTAAPAQDPQREAAQQAQGQAVQPTQRQQAPAQPQEEVEYKRPDMAELLKRMLPEIQRSLPKHMSGDRFARIVLTEMRKNPRLAQSTPESFFGSLLTASTIGLEPGVNGECYLVPYKNGKASAEASRLAKKPIEIFDCELIIGYLGYAKLFYQHPLAQRLAAETVYENDHFRISKGLHQVLEHEPAAGDRGKVIGYWALAGLTTGAVNFDFFTPEQIKALRRGKVGSSGDIPDPEHWMSRKTALRQVMKLMPKSAELATAIQADEQPGSLDQGRHISFIDTASGEVVEQQAVEA